MNQFIFDELTGIPTILATNRVKRDDQTGAVRGKPPKKTTAAVEEKNTESKLEAKSEFKQDSHQEKTTEGAKKPCYFCKGNENLTPPTLYQDADDWTVRVFKNAFPIVADHEIIVHTPGPDHEKDLATMNENEIVHYLRALLNRVHFYTSAGKEVMIFNNRGGAAGASILHPHSQLVALSGFPGIIELEKHSALNYYNEHNLCYWCEMISEESGEKSRVVLETPHYIVLVPKASRWSYETILVPKIHRPNFEFISDVELNDLAKVLRSVLFAYDELFGMPDRNFWMHTQRYDPYHWHIGFIPHIKVLGGLELGAGIWVSDRATPEEAATKLGEKAQIAYASPML